MSNIDMFMRFDYKRIRGGSPIALGMRNCGVCGKSLHDMPPNGFAAIERTTHNQAHTTTEIPRSLLQLNHNKKSMKRAKREWIKRS